MRMMIRIEGRYYYDIGLRGPNERNQKFSRRFGELQPKYLEDFIELYGTNKIEIISYGKLREKKQEIDELLNSS